MLCILVFNRLCCNVLFFFSCALGVLKQKASLWVSPFPMYSSWWWPSLFFNAFQKSMGDLAAVKTQLVLCAVHLHLVSGCCAYQDSYAESIIKKCEGNRERKWLLSSAILKANKKTYSFWKRRKYQSRFGHPELMWLLILLLAGSLAISPVQWIHSGTKRRQFLLWELDGRPTLWWPIQTVSVWGWNGLWGGFESLCIELSSVPGHWQHKRGRGSRYESCHMLTDNVGIFQEVKQNSQVVCIRYLPWNDYVSVNYCCSCCY